MSIKRVEWICPGCGKRYAIPAHVKTPKICPQCRPARSQSSSPEPEIPQIDTAPVESPIAESLPEPDEPDIPQFDEPPALNFQIDDVAPPDEFDAPPPPAAMPRAQSVESFPTLRLVSLAYRILAAFIGIGALGSLFWAMHAAVTVENTNARTTAILLGVGSFAGCLVSAIAALALSEIIRVMLAIERNTRRDSL